MDKTLKSWSKIIYKLEHTLCLIRVEEYDSNQFTIEKPAKKIEEFCTTKV